MPSTPRTPVNLGCRPQCVVEQRDGSITDFVTRLRKAHGRRCQGCISRDDVRDGNAESRIAPSHCAAGPWARPVCYSPKPHEHLKAYYLLQSIYHSKHFFRHLQAASLQPVTWQTPTPPRTFNRDILFLRPSKHSEAKFITQFLQRHVGSHCPVR